MDFSLDEAESAFLKAVLSGVEACPGFGVARGPEDAAARPLTTLVETSLNLATNPQAGGNVLQLQDGRGPLAAHGPGGAAPSGESHHRGSTPISPCHHALSPDGTAGLQRRLQRDASSEGTIEAATVMPAFSPSPRQHFPASSQRPPPQPSPPLPSQPSQLHPQLSRSSLAAAAAGAQQLRPRNVSPVHSAPINRSTPAARAPPAAAPVLSPRQHGGGASPPLSGASPPPTLPPSTTTTTASPFAGLPNSNSTGAISEVSVATSASATSTSSTNTSTQTPYRRHRSSSSVVGAGSGAPGTGGSPCHSRSPSSGSRRSSRTALCGAAVLGPGPQGAVAAAPSAAAGPSLAAPSRRAQGLLQRIQTLEAQLTELLLAEGDAEAVGPDAGAGPGEEAAALLTPLDAAVTPLRPTDLNGRYHHHYPHEQHQHQRPRRPLQQQQQQHAQSRTSATCNAGAAAAAAAAHGTAAGAAPRRRQQQQQQLVFGVAEQLCRDYNSSGVALMEAGLDEAAREQLAKALLLAGPGGPLEGSLEKQREMQIVAHNNLACYYRKFGQPALALEHLQHAARMETAAAAASASASANVAAAAAAAAGPAACSEVCGSVGDAGAADAAAGGGGGQGGPTAATLLNMAAVSSSLEQHMQALSYAARAVRAAAGELQVPLGPLEAALLQGLPQAQLWEVLPQLRRACQGATTQLAMAYYNRAVEQEHLHQWHAALESYRLAVDVASRFVGRGDDLTLTMQQSAEAFKVRLRKLERQGKVRSVRLASPGGLGAGGGSGSGGSCHGLSPPLPGSAAAAAVAAAAVATGGGCAAALPRPHPHLRPLLRCATAVTTTTTAAAAAATTTSVAAAAAAAALAGLPAKGPRASTLPFIAAGRPSSTPVSPPVDFVAGPAMFSSQHDPRVTSSVPVPRRAFSAGRTAPPAHAAAAIAGGRGSASHVAAPLPNDTAALAAGELARRSRSHRVMGTAPVATATAAAAEPPRRGIASHVPAVSHPAGDGAAAAAATAAAASRSAAAATPAAAVLGRDTPRSQRRAGWSPPLPPRPIPPPEGPGADAGKIGIGAGGGGGGGGGTAPEPGPRSGPGSPGLVSGPGALRGVAETAESTARSLPSGGTSGGAAPAATAAAVDPWPSGRQSRGCIPAVASPAPPAPTPAAARTDATAAAAAAAAASAAGSQAEQSWREQPAETSVGGSLAAVAAAAEAAAAELERICAAGEEWQALKEEPGRGRGPGNAGVGEPEGVDSSGGGGGGRQENRREAGRARGPMLMSSPSSSPAQPSTAQMQDAGMGVTSGRVGETWGGSGSLARTVPAVGAPGRMLVPKRDGVTV